jgi:uncharacterized ferritin-like protein (DUF455 family)
MNISDFSKEILLGSSLDSKLFNCDDLIFDEYVGREIPLTPSRSEKIKFSPDQLKFPKKNTLKNDSSKALALHFFANHELLAIEMMAAALYCYPTLTEEDKKFKRGIVSALRDEQKHFKLYVGRINELGVEFGDFPVNDFFWKQMPDLKTPSEFFSMMSLTFEMANLDFCIHYKEIFESLGDDKTASILNTVLEDEITHVSIGRHWLEQWKPTGSLWEYYKSLLPEKITPARAKGIIFSREARLKAGFSEDFINSLDGYRDDFPVTRRKNWKE